MNIEEVAIWRINNHIVLIGIVKATAVLLAGIVAVNLLEENDPKITLANIGKRVKCVAELWENVRKSRN